MSSNLKVNSIVPATGNNVAIGTAGATVSFNSSISAPIGINTTIPGSKLEIYAGGSNYGWQFKIPTDVTDGAGFWKRSNGDFEVVLRDASNSNNHITGTDGSLQFVTSNSEKLRIKSDGNTGIGQSNPNKAKLHVVSNGDNVEEIVAKFRNPYNTAGDSVAKIGFVAGYSDTANDTEGHAYIGGLREGNGNRTSLVFQTSSGSSVAEQFKINSYGHLTAPNQPGFFAYLNGGDITTNVNNNIAWNQTRFNRGGYYSTTNHVFTAPVGGLYLFMCQIWAKNGGSHARTQFRKNNTSISQHGYHLATVNSQNDHAYQMTHLVDMSVNDTMSVFVDNANLTFYAGGSGTTHSYFQGFLVG
tara:strand:- start:1265 stop:2335 length:1071 start_codon:yes stop_codon:yes gene_type:complete